jgi:CAAX prenyl protease-like protein
MSSLENKPTPTAFAYLAPMVAFLLLTAVEGYLPRLDGQIHPLWYPIAYTVKIIIVVIVTWACRSTWRDLAPRPSAVALALAVFVGVIVALLWVGLDGRYPAIPLLGTRSAFDPTGLPKAGEVGFLAVRMLGLVLVVPLIEELFWRSFLMRWVIDQNIERVPIGRVTPLAAAVTSGLFAAAHPEWLPALLTGLLWAWLLWHTKSLFACVVSHAVANLGLGLYVLSTGDWKFW